MCFGKPVLPLGANLSFDDTFSPLDRNQSRTAVRDTVKVIYSLTVVYPSRAYVKHNRQDTPLTNTSILKYKELLN